MKAKIRNPFISFSLALLVGSFPVNEARAMYAESTLPDDDKPISAPQISAEVYIRADFEESPEVVLAIDCTNYQQARQSLEAVLVNETYSILVKLMAQTSLLAMDYQGLGVRNAQYGTARQRCEILLAADYEVGKHEAEYYSGLMDYFGDAIDVPHYPSARRRFLNVLGSRADECRKVVATFYLAEMNFLGKGSLAPDFEQAVSGFSRCKNSESLSAEKKARALCRLGQIFYSGGFGTERNLHKAESSFKSSLSMGALPEEAQRMVRQYLEKIHSRAHANTSCV